MNAMRPLALAALSIFSMTLSMAAAAGPAKAAPSVKTATVDLLLQRQHVGAVVIDDARGQVYFELSDPACSPDGGYIPAAISPTSNDAKRKKIYVAPMDGAAPARPLFDQAADDSYAFAGAVLGAPDVMSPGGRYLAIHHLRDGAERLGLYDLKRREFRYIDGAAGEDERLSDPLWTGDGGLVAALNRGYRSTGLAWQIVRAARNIAAAREAGWRDGAVTAEVVGGGKYARSKDRDETRSYVAIDVSAGAMRPATEQEEAAYRERLKEFSLARTKTAYARLEPSPEALNPPAPQSLLLASSDRGEVFLTNDNAVGSRLHYVAREQGAESVLLRHFNEHLAGVETAVGPIRIDHEDYAGETIKSWLYLPPGASLDRVEPYPLVVIAYPGLIYDTPPENASPFAYDIWTLRLVAPVMMEVFAARGYAVLLPSIPYAKEKGPAEPMSRIMAAVGSAVDGAIETGSVDSDHMALTGHSFGGYAALSVAVQTNRFHSIISAMMVSNIISQYGTFSSHAKIDGARFEQPGGGYDRASVETRLFTLGGQPWDVPDRYVRNSPIFHIQNVDTPIMLIHSDLDTAAHLTQAEEMFSALYRERKEVLYLKYFGEQHTIQQPQNQRDMWGRVFEFLQ